MDISVAVLAGALIIGFVVGGLTGIFGVGGGFLMTPAMMIILCISGDTAVGTSLAAIFVNSSLSMFNRRGSNTVDIKLAITIAAGSIFGVFVGSHIIDVLKDAPKLVILGREQEPLQYFLLVLFLVLLGWVAAYLIYDYKRTSGKSPEKRKGFLAKIKIAPYMHFNSLDEPRMPVLPIVFLGFCVGLLTGLLGVGGGVVVLPALVYLIGQHTAKAVGTSLLLVWIASLAAVVWKCSAGQIDIWLLGVLLLGGIAGTFIGTKIGLRLTGSRLRLYFVFVVIFAIFMVALKLCLLTF